MYLEEHNHCFMHYFGVKTLSDALFPPPLMKPGYGARYETLNDDAKRKVYDKEGEEGLKEQGNEDEQAAQMYRQFFGREPDGKVRIVHGRGGQMHFQVREGLLGRRTAN